MANKKPAINDNTSNQLESDTLDIEETDYNRIEDEDEVETDNINNKNENVEITYENATILITINLLPKSEDSLDRYVLISASNLGDAPVSKLVKEKEILPLPTAIAGIIEELKSDLPKRSTKRKLKHLQAKTKQKLTPREPKNFLEVSSTKKTNNTTQLSLL